jgi:hypothetical protein
MVRSHHAPADKIHHERADLRCRIHRIRVRKRPQRRIGLNAVTTRNRASRRPRVERRRSAARDCQRVPHRALCPRFHRARNRLLQATNRSASRRRSSSRLNSRLNFCISFNLGRRCGRQQFRERSRRRGICGFAGNRDCCGWVFYHFCRALNLRKRAEQQDRCQQHRVSPQSSRRRCRTARKYMPATTELYCARVQVALAPWSHFGWYSAVGFWFRKGGTDVLALSQARKPPRLRMRCRAKFIFHYRSFRIVAGSRIQMTLL